MWEALKPQRAADKHTHTLTSLILDPDGDGIASDVVGRVGTLLAQVPCSQQLAQVRHSWELEPQGKCSLWLEGGRGEVAMLWQGG